MISGSAFWSFVLRARWLRRRVCRGESPRFRAMVRTVGPLVLRSFFRSLMRNASVTARVRVPDIHHNAVQSRAVF